MPPPDPKLKVPPIPELASAYRSVAVALMRSEIEKSASPKIAPDVLSALEARVDALEKRFCDIEALALRPPIVISDRLPGDAIFEPGGFPVLRDVPDMKPWEAAGVSKAKWYRDQKKSGSATPKE